MVESKVLGSNIANQVSDVTRGIKGKKISSERMIEILHSERKYDLLLIKLFDRLHNMRTIKAKPVEKIRKITQDTIVNFIGLAKFFKLHDVENEILILSQQYLDYIKSNN